MKKHTVLWLSITFAVTAVVVVVQGTICEQMAVGAKNIEATVISKL